MTFRIAIAAALLTTACGPSLDLTSGLVVESVSTGWADAGRIEGHHRIVPSLSFKLKNASDRKLRTLEVNALFRRVSEPQEWGSGFLPATGPGGLAPGAETATLTVKSSIGYTGTDETQELLQNSQFVDARVELFAKNGSANWTRIGEFPVSRQLLAP
jgi:hypothetical protein